MAEQAPESVQEVAFEAVAKFIRQFSHDIRNHLGSMDLQAAYLAELITDPESAAEVGKLREMISGAAREIQAVTASLRVSTPNPLVLGSGLFVEDFRARFAGRYPAEAGQLAWETGPGEVPVRVDVEMTFGALSELLRNALLFQDSPAGTPRVTVKVSAAATALVIEILQRSSRIAPAPETWGRTPLLTSRRGGYGLGLFHARQVLAAQGGEVDFLYHPDGQELTTRLTLPVAAGADNDP